MESCHATVRCDATASTHVTTHHAKLGIRMKGVGQLRKPTAIDKCGNYKEICKVESSKKSGLNLVSVYTAVPSRASLI